MCAQDQSLSFKLTNFPLDENIYLLTCSCRIWNDCRVANFRFPLSLTILPVHTLHLLCTQKQVEGDADKNGKASTPLHHHHDSFCWRRRGALRISKIPPSLSLSRARAHLKHYFVSTEKMLLRIRGSWSVLFQNINVHFPKLEFEEEEGKEKRKEKKEKEKKKGRRRRRRLSY